MITCAHGTRTKACHGQVYLCFLRRIWATRELTHVTIEKRLDDDRAKKCARDSATIKQHPRTILSFLFTIEQMELYAFLREKLKEGKRLLRIRVGFIGAILSKKTVLRILMQRKFDRDGRVLLANSCISLSSFCLDRWRNFETVLELFHILSFFFLMFLKRGKEMIIKKIVILNDNIIENVLYNLDFVCIFFFPFSSPSTHCVSNFAFTKLQKGIPTDSAQFANTIPFEVSLSVGQSH